MRIPFHKIPVDGQGSLVEVFKRIPDPRSRFGKRHSLHGMLALLYCAILCGVRSFSGINDFAKNLNLEEVTKFDFGKHGVPTGEIIGKTIRFLNVQLIEQEFTLWMRAHTELQNEWISLDGKTLKGSKDGSKKGVHLLSAILHESKIIIAQAMVGEKTNEIPIAQKMLENLGNLEGAVITTDALNTQVETAQVIIKKSRLCLPGQGQPAQAASLS